LVELADGGTAFFDEIGDLPLDMQVKLLRLLQEGEFRAVGGMQWNKVNLRIVAATHRDLQKEVTAGRFRLDLFYRLNVFAIRLPPLRDRKEDIPLLVRHFMEAGQASGLPWMETTPELMEAFQTYDWPGNVRELKHCIDRLSALQSEGALQMSDLPSPLQHSLATANLHQLSGALAISDSPNRDMSNHDMPNHDMPEFTMTPRSPVISLPQSERHTITRALVATKGERGKAARILGIGRTTLYRKMKQYGIE
jgi:DNA-binding NtrC family response regulator